MKKLFGYSEGPSVARELGLFLIRACVGFTLAIAHGYGKLPPTKQLIGMVEDVNLPSPVLFAWAAGLAEFVGGILLGLGLLTRPAALAIAITMGVAIFGYHAGDTFGRKEMAVLYGVVALGFMLIGSGRFGLDAMIFGKGKPAGKSRSREE